MNTEDDKLPHDEQLSSLYNRAKHDIPSEQIDEAILSAAKRDTSTYSLPYNPFSNNWRIPASLAAVLVLSFGIVTLMENDLSPVNGVTPHVIVEDALIQKPSSIAKEQASLAKARSKMATPPLHKPATTEPAISTDAATSKGLFTSKAKETKRNEKLVSKKKQASQRTKPEMADTLSLSAAMPISTVGITTGTDEQAGLPYWQYKDEGLSIRFIQRLPDQTRGYFIGRGFSAEHAELIAQSCVFQTIFKNISDKNTPSEIIYNMQNWLVHHNGKTGEMKTREKWSTQWQQLNIATPAKLAFEWGLLPTTQDYQAGDYNWGMAIFDLPLASSFTLQLNWQQFGEQRNVTIPNMQCAADIHADPESP